MKVFTLAMIAGFLLIGSLALAWDDPCTLQDYRFIESEEYYLTDFTDDNTGFGPRPDCAGSVTVLTPDNRECVLPYSVWGDTLIVGANPYDMNFKLVDNNRLIPQNDAEWEDVLARNGCPALVLDIPDVPDELVCDPDHLNLCTNQTMCEIVRGYWYNEQCNGQEQCPEYPECPECPICDNVIVPDEPGPFVCPLLGNTYRFDASNISYELSDFQCHVGPGCRGMCDLWYGDLEIGPAYHYPLQLSCQKESISIAGLPCGITSKGALRCLGASIEDYHCYQIGTVTYCFSEEKMVLSFNAKE